MNSINRIKKLIDISMSKTHCEIINLLAKKIQNPRAREMVKRTFCSCREQVLQSQHLHGCSRLCVSVPRAPVFPAGLYKHLHTYATLACMDHRGNTFIDIE